MDTDDTEERTDEATTVADGSDVDWTESDERLVAGRAAWLPERVERGQTGDPSTLSPETAELVETLVSAGETAWAGESVGAVQLRRHVASERWPTDHPLPDWIEEFRRLLSAIVEAERSVPSGTDQVPFVHVLWPVVRCARARLDRPTVLTDRCLESMQRSLLDRLVALGGAALHVDFLSFVADRDPTAVSEGRRSADSTAWYDEYVAATLSGRAGRFFREYAVLARLFTRAVTQWRAAVERLGARVRADRSRLRELVDCDQLGRVVDVESLGDPHGNHETVKRVTFEGGTVVSKPRSVHPERIVTEVASALAADSALASLRVPEVVPGDGYGWMETVEPGDHPTRSALERYYRAAGAVVALAYTLGVTDCHRSNVIAADRSPVLVDAETVFETGFEKRAGDDERAPSRFVSDTVLETGLVPHPLVPANRSGLGSLRAPTSAVTERRWIDPNTDAMDVEYVSATADATPNVPTHDGRPVGPDRFLAAVIEGFETAYEAIRRARDHVASLIDPVDTRILLRDTAAYSWLLDSLATPAPLRNGARHDCELRRALSLRLADPELGDRTRDAPFEAAEWDAIVRAEETALRRRSIPRFTTPADERAVVFDGRRVVTLGQDGDGTDRPRGRLDELSPADRRRQVDLLRGCLETPPVVRRLHRGREL